MCVLPSPHLEAVKESEYRKPWGQSTLVFLCEMVLVEGPSPLYNWSKKLFKVTIWLFCNMKTGPRATQLLSALPRVTQEYVWLTGDPVQLRRVRSSGLKSLLVQRGCIDLTLSSLQLQR